MDSRNPSIFASELNRALQSLGRMIFGSAPVTFRRQQSHCRDCFFDSRARAPRALFVGRRHGSILLLGAMLAIHFIQACTAAQIKGKSADHLAAEIRVLVDRLAKSPCSLKQVEDILRGETSSQQPGRYAIVKGPQHNTIVAIRDDHGDNVVTEMVIYPRSETGLQFKDLQVTMADWQTVQEHKASAPVFQRTSADRTIIVDVYVMLLFAPTDPKSRVVSIRIQVNSRESHKG